MLNWFARRMKEAQQKDETGQGGFTLIELLVVVIIIGILAAIAIPTFLSQRQRAQDADAQSEARNIAQSATAFYSDTGANGGQESYANMSTAANGNLDANYDYNPSGNNNVGQATVYAVNGQAGQGFDVTVTSAAGNPFNFDSVRGTVQPGAANGQPG